MRAFAVLPGEFGRARRFWDATTKLSARCVTSMRDTLPDCCVSIRASANCPRPGCHWDCSQRQRMKRLRQRFRWEERCCWLHAEWLRRPISEKNSGYKDSRNTSDECRSRMPMMSLPRRSKRYASLPSLRASRTTSPLWRWFDPAQAGRPECRVTVLNTQSAAEQRFDNLIGTPSDNVYRLWNLIPFCREGSIACAVIQKTSADLTGWNQIGPAATATQ